MPGSILVDGVFTDDSSVLIISIRSLLNASFRSFYSLSDRPREIYVAWTLIVISHVVLTVIHSVVLNNTDLIPHICTYYITLISHYYFFT